MNMDWIKKQMSISGTTQRTLADFLGLSEQQMSHVFTGRRLIKADEADKLRRFFGYYLPDDIPPTIAVSGKVAAGDHLELMDDYEKGAGIYSIVRPSWLPPHGVAAAEIEGSSAEPWALPGDVIFWKRQAMAVLSEDIGRPVIAELADGKVMMKRLTQGSKPGLWNLLSINPAHPNLFDQEVKWASRVLAPLSRDEIKVIDA